MSPVYLGAFYFRLPFIKMYGKPPICCNWVLLSVDRVSRSLSLLELDIGLVMLDSQVMLLLTM